MIILSIFVLFNCSKKSNVKSDYIEKLKSQINEWNLELEKLDLKAKKLNGAAEIEADAQLTSIRSQINELNNNLEMIKNSADNAWEDLKKGTEDARDNISKAFYKANSEFK